ncbi:hypothetical protein DSO57_1002441 [Entomophthora muscae]|uniref:Uncharacterized protein n=1 Tax=Entomophthora muscae TaxID=34485 RepID=A0ACC2RZL5_9FUNG|nr:hypothetical protein DSO57_1002441 [Entomophthora muscae]
MDLAVVGALLFQGTVGREAIFIVPCTTGVFQPCCIIANNVLVVQSGQSSNLSKNLTTAFSPIGVQEDLFNLPRLSQAH